jgi:hypothetical protein
MPAKRHHYVPQVLLRRFSSDQLGDNPPLWWLDIGSGKPRRTAVNNLAVISHYYRLEELAGYSRTLIESSGSC